MDDRSPVERVSAQIPFTIAAIIACAVLSGLIVMLPFGKAVGVVLLVTVGAAIYTAIEYRMPDLDGDDPHDRAWVIAHMTRNTVALAIVMIVLMGLRRAGVPKDVVTILAPLTLLALAYGWYRWKGRI